jgi:hypothetical protein
LERRDVRPELGPLDLGRVEEPVDEGDVGEGRARDGEVALRFFGRRKGKNEKREKKLVWVFFRFCSLLSLSLFSLEENSPLLLTVFDCW